MALLCIILRVSLSAGQLTHSDTDHSQDAVSAADSCRELKHDVVSTCAKSGDAVLTELRVINNTISRMLTSSPSDKSHAVTSSNLVDLLRGCNCSAETNNFGAEIRDKLMELSRDVTTIKTRQETNGVDIRSTNTSDAGNIQ